MAEKRQGGGTLARPPMMGDGAIFYRFESGPAVVMTGDHVVVVTGEGGGRYKVGAPVRC